MVRSASANVALGSTASVAFSSDLMPTDSANFRALGSPRVLHRKYGSRFSKNGPCRALSPDEIEAVERKLLSGQYQWLGEKSMPPNFWESRDNRVHAINVLVERATRKGKHMEDIVPGDFVRDNIGYLLRKYYSSPLEALEDAGFSIPYPWTGRARVPAHYWESKENRVKAVRWLVAKLGKQLEGISYLDLVDVAYHVFTDNGLSGLIRRSYYHGSPFAAFLEAELVTESDRAAFEKAVVERMVKSLRNANLRTKAQNQEPEA